MLIHDFRVIGNRMFAYRKKMGLTRGEIAEAADISDRTYADIERGSVNMRIETFLRICEALHADPNDILLEENLDREVMKQEVIERLEHCVGNEQKTALTLLRVYLDSLKPTEK